MAEVDVELTRKGQARVTVREERSETSHLVTIDRERQGVAPEVLVEASFRFLLDREPKESILSRFNLSIVERYFPEYDERIDDYL